MSGEPPPGLPGWSTGWSDVPGSLSGPPLPSQYFKSPRRKGRKSPPRKGRRPRPLKGGKPKPSRGNDRKARRTQRLRSARLAVMAAVIVAAGTLIALVAIYH